MPCDEERFLEELEQKERVKEVARQSAAELNVTAEKTALCPDGQRRYRRSRTMTCSTP